MIYRRDFEVDVHEVDFNGIARASALMRYIQTAAQCQLTDNSMSYEELARMNRAFLLSRITMEFTEPLRAYERATAYTFPCESRGFSFFRCYGLEKEGRPIGRAVSAWALIDTDSRGLIRVDHFPLGIDTHESNGLILSRFMMPAELTYVGDYLVGYGITDQNRHMNNTAYPDMYSTFLPLDGMRIHTISINYQQEAPAGSLLTVHYATDDRGVFYFRTLREDGVVNSEAEISLVAIE